MTALASRTGTSRLDRALLRLSAALEAWAAHRIERRVLTAPSASGAGRRRPEPSTASAAAAVHIGLLPR